MENEGKYSGILTTIGVIAGIVFTLALGVYLNATLYPKEEGKTIIRWVVDASPIRKEQIRLFESRYPKIHVINDAGAEPQRLLTQLAGDVPPDVMALYDPQSIRLFAKNGTLLDLTPYIEKYGIRVKKLYNGLDPYIRYQGKIVGIPENCGPFVMFYNRKLFRDAGIPYPKSGWTWDECVDAAKKLTTYKTISGRQVPDRKGLYVDNGSWSYFIWMYHGHLFSKDGKTCVMDSPEVKKGIRYWADLRLKYHVMPTTSEAASMAPTGSWGSDALLFRESKVGMMLNGRWMIIQYREQKDLDWDVVSVPQGMNRVTVLASKSYSIPARCRHRDQALKFIAHLLSDSNQLLVSNYGDGNPTVNDPNLNKAFLWNPQYPTERNNITHINEMKYAKVVESSPYINNLDMNAIMTTELDKMWLGTQSPDEACDQIARQVNAIIKRNLTNPNFLD